LQAITPGTHITPHHGPTNKKLRCHLPLVVPEMSFHEISESELRLTIPVLATFDISSEPYSCLRVHDQLIRFCAGSAFVFDDSFEHEVFHLNKYEAPRVVLIIDIWHPDLTEAEVKFLRFLESQQQKNLARLMVTYNTSAKDACEGNEKLDLSPTEGIIDSDTFLSVIMKARGAVVDDALVWGI
jgi:aspartate beta-hydroxylase